MRDLHGYKNSLSRKLQHFFGQTFFLKKLNNWFGYLLAICIALGFGYLLATNLVVGLGVFGAILGLFVAIICISSAETGLYIIAGFSFFVSFFSRLLFKGEMPIGALFDALVLATFIGLFTRKSSVKQEFSQFTKNTLVAFIFFTLFFNAIQFFNPNAMSLNTNILAIRKFVGYIFVMFIAYAVFDTYEKAIKYLRYLFIIASISAFYGCIQQLHGYFNFEMELILADPHGLGLIFVGGEFRKFSTMSDPSTFGILMAVCAVFFLIIGLNEKNRTTKNILYAGTFLMILGMAYSGTRTAYATIIAGIAFFILLNFEKKSTRLFGIVASVVFAVLLFAPFYGGKTLARFRTTFMGSKDESYNVRIQARAFIQPYIRSHPIGGGLGTTGFNGVREHPGHYLANFQPDSSYVKRAAETGWIGLAITCILYYLSLKAGLRAYFRARHERNKVLAAACVTSLFAFYIAEFAQVAIGGVSDVVVYYPILAIILKLKYYDKDTETKPSV
jgi:putative inorganic carbon (HCO3(-)) transporter